MPWRALEAGLFKKYNMDHELVFIASSGIVTAALLGGDADMTVTGGIGNVIAYVRGSTDVAFIGGGKNTITQTLVAGGENKKTPKPKGKKERGQPKRGQPQLLFPQNHRPATTETNTAFYFFF